MSVDITNHLIPWTQVKRMLKGAWAEGYDAGTTDSSNYEDVRDGHAYYDDYEETPNPYQEGA